MNPKPSPSGSSFSKSALLKIDQIIMKKFITYYPIYSEKLGFVSKYSSYVLAPDLKRATKKIKERNLDEQIESIGMNYKESDLINAVNLFDLGNYKHCMHAVIFMSYVLVRAGRVDPSSLLSDIGVIHELLHLITNCNTNPLSYIRSLVEEVQQSYYSLSH